MGGLELFIILAMIAFNSVFAAYEIALAAVSAVRMRILAGENRPGAVAALYMKENVEGSLAAIQLGITLFGAIAAATGGAGAEEMIAPAYQQRLGLSSGFAEALAVATVVLPLTAVTIIVGELVPKVFALRNKEWVCLILSPGMRWFTFGVWPAVWFFETVVEAITDWGERRFRVPREGGKTESAELQELRAVVSLARTSRLIGAREEGIILGAARLSSRPVREIMLPAEAISMLDLNAPLADALVAVHLEMHTRFPVTERPGDPQGIVGYANVKDIVAVLRLSPQDASLRSILRPIPAMTESETIATCLERLIQGASHIAVVREVGGRITGLVTLEDIVEELMGDIRDEYDRPPDRLTRSGAAWVVGGGVLLERFREASQIDLTADPPPNGATTLSEWVVGHLGRGVRSGDVIERGTVRVVVRKSRRQQVLEAQVGAISFPSPRRN